MATRPMKNMIAKKKLTQDEKIQRLCAAAAEKGYVRKCELNMGACNKFPRSKGWRVPWLLGINVVVDRMYTDRRRLRRGPIYRSKPQMDCHIHHGTK